MVDPSDVAIRQRHLFADAPPRYAAVDSRISDYRTYRVIKLSTTLSSRGSARETRFGISRGYYYVSRGGRSRSNFKNDLQCRGAYGRSRVYRRYRRLGIAARSRSSRG